MGSPIGAIYQVRTVYTCGPQTALNVYHYVVFATTGVGADDGQIASAVGTNYDIVPKSVISDNARYEGLDVQKIWPLPVTQAVKYTLTAGPGVNTSPPCPLQTTGLISFYTGLAGRAGRGRLYIPFPPIAAAQEPNGITAGFQVVLAQLSQRMSNTISAGVGANTSQLVPVLWHRKTRTYDTILNWFVRTKFATQRKRGDYGRPNPNPLAVV